MENVWYSVYFIGISYVLWPFGIFFLANWCIFSRFGILYQGKPGNPATMDKKGKKGLK
jgi:hypothetical protein